jgi:hypothetical protein
MTHKKGENYIAIKMPLPIGNGTKSSNDRNKKRDVPFKQLADLSLSRTVNNFVNSATELGCVDRIIARCGVDSV